MKSKTIIKNIFVLFLALSLFSSCGQKESAKAIRIGVFVPGIIADSPTYANLVSGVKEAVEEYNASLKENETKATFDYMEAGTNQSEWATKLTELTASGSYDVIVSSNESLPELAEPLTKTFPKQKYILMHGVLNGNKNIYCVNYDQREQAYLTGYLSSLMSKNHKVALIAAQEYPVMNNILYPYFSLGAKEAAEGTTSDFRIVGNWYDAAKGAEIADALYNAGVDVILPICGGASQGVISSAKEHGMYLAYIDENSFVKAPGTVISSCATEQKKATKEAVLSYLQGSIAWGETKDVGLKDGYIEFIQDDILYKETVPEDIREKIANLVNALKDGTKALPEAL